MNTSKLTYGRLNGLVCLGVAGLFFLMNVLAISQEDASFLILMVSPPVLFMVGVSLIIWPGAPLSFKEVDGDFEEFWEKSPKEHRVIWMLACGLGIAGLILQMLSILGVVSLDFESCFFAKYFGIGNCGLFG